MEHEIEKINYICFKLVSWGFLYRRFQIRDYIKKSQNDEYNMVVEFLKTRWIFIKLYVWNFYVS